jgi:hypothetical protein
MLWVGSIDVGSFSNSLCCDRDKIHGSDDERPDQGLQPSQDRFRQFAAQRGQLGEIFLYVFNFGHDEIEALGEFGLAFVS